MFVSPAAFRLPSLYRASATHAAAHLQPTQGLQGGLLTQAFRGLHVSAVDQDAAAKKPSSKKKSTSDSSDKSAAKKAEKKKLVSQLGKDKLPRKFSSPWMLFNYKHIQDLKSKIPAGEKSPPAPELTKQSSAAYKNLSDSDMQTLKREWEQKRDEYNQAFEALVNSMSPEDIKKENSYRAQQRKAGKSHKKNLIDPTKPKAPKNAFMYFYLEQRSLGESSDQHVTNVTKLCAEKWSDMSESEKRPYEQQAQQDKQRYTTEMEQWKRENSLE